MNKFDLYSMIFFALDADWDDTHDEELGRYLSDANPFLFAGKVSAVRSVYNDFSAFVGDRAIEKENSFEIAKEYVRHINIDAVTESFALLEEEQWNEALEEYLASN